MLLADMGAPLVGDSNMYTIVHVQLQHQWSNAQAVAQDLAVTFPCINLSLTQICDKNDIHHTTKQCVHRPAKSWQHVMLQYSRVPWNIDWAMTVIFDAIYIYRGTVIACWILWITAGNTRMGEPGWWLPSQDPGRGQQQGYPSGHPSGCHHRWKGWCKLKLIFPSRHPFCVVSLLCICTAVCKGSVCTALSTSL